jgi:hypothetical protein
MPSLQKGEWSGSFYPIGNLEKATEHILAQAARGRDIYFSPVIWKKPTLERSNIIGSWALWMDFDGNAPRDWPENPNDHATSDPGQAPGPPSIRVQSSSEGHEHCYWVLDEFATNVEWIETANRNLAYTHKADTSGWDIFQLLRPPHTTNYGKTNKRLPVLLASLDDRRYSAEEFRNLTPVAKTVNEEISAAELPDIKEVLGRYRWDNDELALLNKSKEEISGVSEGRSGAMMRLAYYCAERGMNEQEIYTVMFFVDEKWEKFKLRRDRQKRLLDLVNKAKQKYPEGVEDTEFSGLLNNKEEVETEVDPTTVFSFMDFVQADFRINWLIEGLVAERTVGLIASAPGVGKTQFMCGLGMSVATGRTFLGFKVLVQHRALFFSLEMGKELLHSFLAQMVKAYPDPEEQEMLQENFKLLPAGQQMSLKKAGPGKISQGRVFLEMMIEKYEPTAVYFDSLARILPGKFSDEEVLELYAYLSVIRARYGVYVFIIHHNRKAQGDNKRPKNLEDIYGSQFIGGESDVALTLWRPEQGKIIEVNMVKNRLAAQCDPFNIKREANLQFVRTTEEITFNGLRAGALSTSVGKPEGLHSFD